MSVQCTTAALPAGKLLRHLPPSTLPHAPSTNNLHEADFSCNLIFTAAHIRLLLGRPPRDIIRMASAAQSAADGFTLNFSY